MPSPRFTASRNRLSGLALAIGLGSLLGTCAGALRAAEGSDVDFGGPGDQPGQFHELRDLAFDAQGALYVLEGQERARQGGGVTGNGRVQKFDQAGKALAQIDVKDAALGDQQDPQRLALGADGTIYVTQPRADRVQRFSAGGSALPPIAIPHALAITAWTAGGATRFAVLAGGDERVTADHIDVIGADGALGAPIPLQRPLSDVVDVAADPKGDLWILAARHQLYRVDPMGRPVTVIGAASETRSSDGSEPLHSIAVGPDGALYAWTFGNPGHLLRYSPDLATVTAREGQFRWADPWSVHSGYSPLAIDPAGRLWVGAAHEFARDNPNFAYYRPAPAVLRVTPDFFDPQRSGVTQRQVLALGFNPALAVDLPSGIAYDLAPIRITAQVGKAERRVHRAHGAWRVLDTARHELAAGAFDLDLVDGAEARQDLSFTPAAYGWCLVECAWSSGGVELGTSAQFFGVTQRYAGLVALGKDTPPGGATDPMRNAFAGLINQRLHAVNEPQRLDELEQQIASAQASGCTWFVQLSDKKDCQPDAVRGIVTRLKGRVPIWEVMNEPNFTFNPHDYVATLKAARAVIKEVDPAARIMGPDVCGIDLGWYEAFYKEGGKDLVDILSLHDYEGHESIDPAHWRWKVGALRALMAKYGDAAKEVWQTERAISGVRGENWMGGAQAARLGLHVDLMASLGIPPEHDNHFYVNDHGFGDCPSWVWSANGPHPAVFTQRVRQALTAGRTYAGQLDFGDPGNELFLGLRYAGAAGDVLVLRNLGLEPLPLALSVSGGDAAIEVVDAFGNLRAVKPSGGALRLDVGQLATYVRLAPGRTAQPVRQDFGRNHAPRAHLAWSGAADGDPATLTDGVLQTWQAGNPSGGTDGKALWSGGLGAEPQTLDLTFDQPRRIDRVVLYGLHADNGFCALLDYDLQVRSAGAWTTVREVRSACAPSEPLATVGCRYATWLLDDNRHCDVFPAVVADGVRVVARRATHGFLPDASTRAWGNAIPSKVMLREIAVYGPAPAATISAALDVPQRAAAFASTVLTVTVTAGPGGPRSATVHVAPPTGWTAAPADAPVALEAGKAVQVAVTLTPPADLPAGATPIDVILRDSAGAPLDVTWATLVVTPPLTLAPQAPGPLDAKGQTLAIALHSGAPQPLAGRVRLALRGPSRVAPVEQDFPAIAPGQSATVAVQVPGVDLAAGTWSAQWTVTAGHLVMTAGQDLGVRRWAVLGTFAAEIDHDFGPEAGVDLAKASIDRMGNEQRWRLVTTDPQGYLDLTAAFQQHDNVCAYAAAWVRPLNPGAATLAFGTDDGGKVWFNGRQVQDDRGSHGASPGAVKVPVDLKAGWNQVLFKVMQGGGGWGMYCEVLDATGKPVAATWAARPE